MRGKQQGKCKCSLHVWQSRSGQPVVKVTPWTCCWSRRWCSHKAVSYIWRRLRFFTSGQRNYVLTYLNAEKSRQCQQLRLTRSLSGLHRCGRCLTKETLFKPSWTAVPHWHPKTHLMTCDSFPFRVTRRNLHQGRWEEFWSGYLLILHLVWCANPVLPAQISQLLMWGKKKLYDDRGLKKEHKYVFRKESKQVRQRGNG